MRLSGHPGELALFFAGLAALIYLAWRGLWRRR